MKLGFRRGYCGGFWTAIYAVCVVFVLSFILFEVLDVDGSDFPTLWPTMAVRLAEPPHDDIKRAVLQDPVKIWVTDAVLVVNGPGESMRPERTAALRPSPPAPTRGYRIALPRASLAGAFPAA